MFIATLGSSHVQVQMVENNLALMKAFSFTKNIKDANAAAAATAAAAAAAVEERKKIDDGKPILLRMSSPPEASAKLPPLQTDMYEETVNELEILVDVVEKIFGNSEHPLSMNMRGNVGIIRKLEAEEKVRYVGLLNKKQRKMYKEHEAEKEAQKKMLIAAITKDAPGERVATTNPNIFLHIPDAAPKLYFTC